MAARLNQAERLRRCRHLFERAMALGCVPAEVRRIEADERHAAAMAQLDTRCALRAVNRSLTQGNDHDDDQDDRRDQFWWQRL